MGSKIKGWYVFANKNQHCITQSNISIRYKQQIAYGANDNCSYDKNVTLE